MTFKVPVAAALVAAFMLILSGCRSGALTPQQAAGKQLFDARCAHCHIDNDLALKPPPPDLHHLFRSGKLPSGAPATDSQVIRTVIAGKGNMPPFAGRFDEEQMDDLLAYLHAGIR